MDPPPLPPPPAATTSPPKLRLMCSYGGQILPRPLTKSLFYAGGDTRIIATPATAATTLSSLTTHLATSLHINNSFTLKYQLPSHDLDSLISLSNDDDLLIMLDEHHRLSPTPSRIRLFLFQTDKTPPMSSNVEMSQFNNELKHPKTETWFADVLKSAKIMQKGLGLEGNCDGGNNSNEANCGLSGAESMVLETGSSFGSTSSSVSLSNLPAKSGQVEDLGAGLVDNKVKFSASGSITTSDNSVGVATAVSQPHVSTYQEPAASMENKACYLIESESKIMESSSIGVDMHKTSKVSAFPLSLQFDQPQVQLVHTAAPHYLPQNPNGMMPVSSYYVMSAPVPQQQTYYHNNQPAPVYFVPVGHPYNFPAQSGLMNPASVASCHSPAHNNPCLDPTQVAYKVGAAPPMPEIASQVFGTVPMANSLVNVPRNENYQQAGGLPQVNEQAQPFGLTSTETANYSGEFDDDPLHLQIYKSQPPPPKLPAQYSTMKNSTTVRLSEALSQSHTDNAKQQVKASQPQ